MESPTEFLYRTIKDERWRTSASGAGSRIQTTGRLEATRLQKRRSHFGEDLVYGYRDGEFASGSTANSSFHRFLLYRLLRNQCFQLGDVPNFIDRCRLGKSVRLFFPFFSAWDRLVETLANEWIEERYDSYEWIF